MKVWYSARRNVLCRNWQIFGCLFSIFQKEQKYFLFITFLLTVMQGYETKSILFLKNDLKNQIDFKLTDQSIDIPIYYDYQQ